MKKIAVYICVILVFVCYHFYNYKNRRDSVNAVESYAKENNLIRIWNQRIFSFNLFDFILEDKTQSHYIFIVPESFQKIDSLNYSIQSVFWEDPSNLETLENSKIERHGNSFTVTVNDLFWTPISSYEIEYSNTKGNFVETVDNWIKSTQPKK